MRKPLIPVGLFALLLLVGIGGFTHTPIAHADEGFSTWDYTPSLVSSPNYSLDVSANNPVASTTAPYDLVLKGWTVSIKDIGTTQDAYFQYDDLTNTDPNDGACIPYATAWIPSLGTYEIILPTPFVIAEGALPELHLKSEGTCTTNSTVRVAGIAGATTFPYVYEIWNFVGDGDFTTHIIRINEPVNFSGSNTSPVNIDFDYQQDSTNLATGYTLEFHAIEGPAAGQIVSTHHNFSDGGISGTYNATTTQALDQGTWQMFVYLDDIVQFNFPSSEFAVDQANVNGIPPANFDAPLVNGADASACVFNFDFSISDCFSYIFLPSSNLFTNYTSLPTLLSSKFPFSYFASIVATWKTLTDDNSNASPTMALNLNDLDIGSTTPLGNFLPNFTFFSASTTKAYFPTGVFDAFKALASAALVLTLFSDIFFTTRNLIKT